jgi:hypothetical protein
MHCYVPHLLLFSFKYVKLADVTLGIFKTLPGVTQDLYPLNPFVTSGIYVSHLQRVFSSQLG